MNGWNISTAVVGVNTRLGEQAFHGLNLVLAHSDLEGRQETTAAIRYIPGMARNSCIIGTLPARIAAPSGVPLLGLTSFGTGIPSFDRVLCGFEMAVSRREME